MNLYRNQDDADQRIVSAVETVAADRGIPMAQVALAWVSSRSAISAPIVGATKTRHIADAVAGAALALTDAEISTLESAYTPREPSGFE